MKIIYALALLPSLVLANGPSTPSTLPEVVATADATATQSQNAISSTSQSQSTTNQLSSGATSTNAGNEQAVSFDYPRQAPAIGQGSLAIGTCGIAANGGGSGSGGAGFLGLAWTPKDCKLLLAAQGYAALGMNDSACEMLNGIGPVRARWKELGMSPPSCKVSAPSDASTLPAPPSHEGGGAASAGSSSHAEKVEAQKAQVRSGK